MPTLAAGAAILGARVPAYTGNIVAAEWTERILTYDDGGFTPGFRMVVSYYGVIGSSGHGVTFFSVLQNLNGVFVNDDYADTIPVHPGRNMGWSSQSESVAGLQDGVLFTDDETRFPRFGRYFNNEPPVVGPTETWKGIGSRTKYDLPLTLTYRAKMVGFVTDPVGNFDRSRADGAWTPLVGDFAMWKVEAAIDGQVHDAGVFFLPKIRAERLNPATSCTFFPEIFYNVPTRPISGQKFELDVSGVRMFDGSVWHEIPDFVVNNTNDNTDPDHGWIAYRRMGKLTGHAGIGFSEENVPGRYILSGLRYLRGDTFEEIPFRAVRNIGVGSDAYEGPCWDDTAPGYPFVLQERDRGFYVVHPFTAIPVVLEFVCEKKGTHRFVGEFARADDTVAGDGVDVSIVSGASTLFSATITTPMTGTANDPFQGASSESFDVSKALVPGDRVRFAVSPKASFINDSTAFRVMWSIDVAQRRQPAPKGDPMYVPPGSMQATDLSSIGGPSGIVSTQGLWHRVFFFDDADDAEIWSSIPDGAIALAYAQSESDGAADVLGLLNSAGQFEVVSETGSRKTWIHLWGRASRRPAAGSDTRPVTSGTAGYVPRGTGMYSADLTLSGDNLANGKILGFHRYRHQVLGFRDLVTGDTYVGKSGIVSMAFQPSWGTRGFVKLGITARDTRSTTIGITLAAGSAPVDGWLHLWSN